MNPYLRNLLIGSYLWFLGEGLLGPLYAVFAEEIGGDILELTGAYAAYLVIGGVASMVVGKVADYHAKKHLMVAGYALNTVATFGYVFVASSIHLLAVQAVLGLANALATPTWNALFALHMDPGRSGVEWGWSEGVPQIISGIAVVAGGFVVLSVGFRGLFLAMGVLQALATVVQARVYIVSRKPHPHMAP